VRTQDVALGYLALPDEAAPPGIVVLHDVWGLGDHPRDLARRLAGEGFGALALDLYRREGEVRIEDPGAWMRALSDRQVIGDVQAGIDFLAGEAPTAGRPVGVTGVCMGGMYALLAACGCRGLGAAVSFYGMLSYEHGLLHAESGPDLERKPRQPLDAVAELACPLLACFGAEDAFIPAGDIATLKQRLARSPQPADVVVYPGAGHAFLNDTRPEAYRPEAARDAWARMVAFFRRHLK
jgi:carboxymethylenebutenolidase